MQTRAHSEQWTGCQNPRYILPTVSENRGILCSMGFLYLSLVYQDLDLHERQRNRRLHWCKLCLLSVPKKDYTPQLHQVTADAHSTREPWKTATILSTSIHHQNQADILGSKPLIQRFWNSCFSAGVFHSVVLQSWHRKSAQLSWEKDVPHGPRRGADTGRPGDTSPKKICRIFLHWLFMSNNSLWFCIYGGRQCKLEKEESG